MTATPAGERMPTAHGVMVPSEVIFIVHPRHGTKLLPRHHSGEEKPTLAVTKKALSAAAAGPNEYSW